MADTTYKPGFINSGSTKPEKFAHRAEEKAWIVYAGMVALQPSLVHTVSWNNKGVVKVTTHVAKAR